MTRLTPARLTTLLATALASTLWACTNGDGDADNADRKDEAPAAVDLDGEELYLTNCASCHQADGAGAEGVFPALADNPLVTAENPTGAIVTILNGRAGMPRWGDELNDAQIAEIVSYLRADLGAGDGAEVAPATVAELRDEQGNHAAT